MSVSEKVILEHVTKPGYHPSKIKILARNLNIRPREYSRFRKMIKNMIAKGKLARLRGGRISPPEVQELVTGEFSATKSGGAFIITDDSTLDIQIPKHLRSTALDGDTVKARLTGENWRGKPVGEVIEVLKRNLRTFVGTYRVSRYGSYVVPDRHHLPTDISVTPPKGKRIENGTKVVVALQEWKDPFAPLQGRIVQVLGHADDPHVNTLSVIHHYDLPTKFSAAVLGEAKQVETRTDNREITGRLDLRKKTVFTIDPEDARDYDDAISLEKRPGGYQLGVHIADVSHYVPDGGRLDKEARNRCFSVYLVDMVIPMLPEKLSNDLCSLKEKQDRFTMSVLIDIDDTGEVTNYRISESIIRSRARLTYEQVQHFLDTGDEFENQKRVGKTLRIMKPLAELLIKKRMNSGSLDLDLPEYKVIVDQDGQIAAIKRKVRSMSHRLVEEYMLLANRIVARELLSKSIPTLYRVHPPPNEKKIKQYVDFAASLGYKASFGSTPKSNLISSFLDSIRGSEKEELLTELLIRAMEKARYQPANVGHFGLAFPHYLHFTSPIRRYPDLIVHRIIKSMLRQELKHSQAGRLKSSLTRIGKRCSEQEITIMKAEMDTLKIKQAQYLSQQLGEIYKGVISGMLRFGFFVRLQDIGAEGMVRLSEVGGDYYQVDLERFIIVGIRSGRRFRMGDRVMVQVVSVATETGKIDLRLIDGGGPKRPGVRARRVRK